MARARTFICLTITLVWVAAAAGCGSRDVHASASPEVEKLKRQVVLGDDALSEARQRIAALDSENRNLQEERERLVQEVAFLQQSLREQKEKVAEASKEKVVASGKLVELQYAYERLDKTLKAVQTEAGNTVQELSNIRLKSQENEDRLREIEHANAGLRQENKRLATERDNFEEQLKRKEVALRSATETASPHGDNEQVIRLQAQLDGLRQTAASFQEERVNLHKQIEALKSKLPAEALAEVAQHIGSADRGIYEDDPAGLGAEVWGFTSSRFGKMVSGEAAWDVYDILMTAGSAAFLFVAIWVLWYPRRRRKRRELREELAGLRERLKEAEARSANGGDSAQRPRPQRQRKGSFVRRGGDFSPILSVESVVDEEGTEPAASASGEVSEPDAAPAEPAARGERPGGAARGSNIIGARQWHEGQSAGADSQTADAEDVPGHTQIIQHLGELELRPPKRGAKETGRDPLAVRRRRESESAEGEDFGNTQIIANVGELDSLRADPALQMEGPLGPGKGAAPKSSKGPTSAELMSELEELIGKKVDELIR